MVLKRWVILRELIGVYNKGEVKYFICVIYVNYCFFLLFVRIVEILKNF